MGGRQGRHDLFALALRPPSALQPYFFPQPKLPISCPLGLISSLAPPSFPNLSHPLPVRLPRLSARLGISAPFLPLWGEEKTLLVRRLLFSVLFLSPLFFSNFSCMIVWLFGLQCLLLHPLSERGECAIDRLMRVLLAGFRRETP